MTYYGLDDSQRPLNRNIAVLRKNRILYLTLHLLYRGDDNSFKYIWTLSQPEKEHGIFIAKFLTDNCNQEDTIYACPHYSMYSELGKLGFLIINGWAKHSEQSKLRSRADLHAKKWSANIAQAVEKGMLENYEEFYFGDRKYLENIINRKF